MHHKGSNQQNEKTTYRMRKIFATDTGLTHTIYEALKKKREERKKKGRKKEKE